jgi:ribosomal protein S18 acetylase RimI-like enzyme
VIYREGIAARLLDVCHEMSSKKAPHITNVSLHVRPSNKGAIALYEQAGFQVEKPRTPSFAILPFSRDQNLVMVRWLQPPERSELQQEA